MQIVAGRFEKNIFSNSALFGLVIKVTPYEWTRPKLQMILRKKQIHGN